MTENSIVPVNGNSENQIENAAPNNGDGSFSKLGEFQYILRQQSEQMAKQCDQLKALTDEVENLRKQLTSAGGNTAGGPAGTRPVSAFELKMKKALDRKKKKHWLKQSSIDDDEKLFDLYCQLGDSCQRVDKVETIKAIVEKIDQEAEQSGKLFNPDWRDPRKIEPNSTYVMKGCFLHRLFQDATGSVSDRLEIARYFVEERGASVDIRQEFWGWTPLMMASRRGYKEIVEFFLDHEASLERTDFDGATTLIFAAKHSQAEVVRLLLQRGAFIDHQTKCDGWTALMWASIKGSTEIVRLLLENGANPRLTNKNELTAVELATLWSQSQIVAFLK